MNRVKTSLLYLRSPLVPHLFLANAVARCHCSSISLLLAVCDPVDFYSPLCTSNTYVLRTVNCAGTSRLTRSVKSCVNSDLFYAHVDVFFSYEVTRSIKRIPCEPFVFFPSTGWDASRFPSSDIHVITPLAISFNIILRDVSWFSRYGIRMKISVSEF